MPAERNPFEPADFQFLRRGLHQQAEISQWPSVMATERDRLAIRRGAIRACVLRIRKLFAPESRRKSQPMPGVLRQAEEYRRWDGSTEQVFRDRQAAKGRAARARLHV